MFWASVRIWTLTVTLLAIQSSFPDNWPRPDWILLFLVPLTQNTDSRTGALFGFAAGLFLGVLSCGSLGIMAGVYSITGYLLGLYKEDAQSLFMQYFANIMGIAFVGLVLIGLTGILSFPGLPLPVSIRSWILPCMLWNVILVFPVSLVFSKIVGRSAFRKQYMAYD